MKGYSRDLVKITKQVFLSAVTEVKDLLNIPSLTSPLSDLIICFFDDREPPSKPKRAPEEF